MRIVAILMVTLLSGCNLFDSHVRQMDLLRGMAADVAGRLNDGAIGQIAASGQALNPGIRVRAAIVYEAVANFDGLAGQYSISAQGTLGDRELPAAIMAVVNDASLTNDRRAELLSALLREWTTSSMGTTGTVIEPQP